MEKLLLDYCLLQHRNIGHYLSLCVERAEAESVHQLRVSIKKFRAISKLLEYFLPEGSYENREQLAKLRALFKLAGQLRDAQVQVILFNYYLSELNFEATDFQYFLRKAEQSALKKFHSGFASFGRYIAEKPFRKLNHNLLKQSPDDAFHDKASKLIEKRLKKLRKAIQVVDSDSDMHKIRIQLKQLRYMVSALSENDACFEPFSIAIAELRLTEIQLGRWHDLTVFRETIGRYIDRKQKKSNSNLHDVLTLNSTVTIDIEMFRRQILELFRQFNGKLVI